MHISIIVPVYNNASDLRACLSALIAASCPGSEIIVVDDGSTDDTPLIAAEKEVRLLRLTRNSGPTAAHELIKLNCRPLVLEKHDKVGGLAHTGGYKGFYCDMGGHRFFTKASEVNRMWHEVLGADFLRRPRLSRIYYDQTFFYYPLKPLNALIGLGLWQSLLIALSYIRWQVFPYRQEDTFEQWVTNRFGRRLFRPFFKAYTEKV